MPVPSDMSKEIASILLNDTIMRLNLTGLSALEGAGVQRKNGREQAFQLINSCLANLKDKFVMLLQEQSAFDALSSEQKQQRPKEDGKDYKLQNRLKTMEDSKRTTEEFLILGTEFARNVTPNVIKSLVSPQSAKLLSHEYTKKFKEVCFFENMGREIFGLPEKSILNPMAKDRKIAVSDILSPRLKYLQSSVSTSIEIVNKAIQLSENQIKLLQIKLSTLTKGSEEAKEIESQIKWYKNKLSNQNNHARNLEKAAENIATSLKNLDSLSKDANVNLDLTIIQILKDISNFYALTDYTKEFPNDFKLSGFALMCDMKRKMDNKEFLFFLTEEVKKANAGRESLFFSGYKPEELAAISKEIGEQMALVAGKSQAARISIADLDAIRKSNPSINFEDLMSQAVSKMKKSNDVKPDLPDGTPGKAEGIESALVTDRSIKSRLAMFTKKSTGESPAAGITKAETVVMVPEPPTRSIDTSNLNATNTQTSSEAVAAPPAIRVK